MAVALEDRFWSKVEFNGWDGCWLWTAARKDADSSYGVFKIDGRRVYAHRVAYELLVGPVPSDLTLDHVAAWGCGNPACVNPLHLEAVTIGENGLRGSGFAAVNARKTECPHGHPYDEENTYIDGLGYRHCRACGRAGACRRRAEKRA